MHKNNLFVILIASSIAMLTIPMLLGNSNSDAQEAPTTRAVHTPVVIQSDTELAISNSVTGGSGTVNDPYVIEGWNIDADGSPYGIMVSNTTHYLEIRFNQVFGSGSAGGILLRNVSNVIVLSNAVIDGGGNGIVVRGSRSVSITFNWVQGHSSYGIFLQNSYLIDVSDNWIGYGGAGIYMNGTAEVHAIHNSILHNEGVGVELASKSAATIVAKNAFIHNSNDGVQASDSGFGNVWHEKDNGNYWSDYQIRYPSAKNDGRVWDTMYLIVMAGGSGVPEGDDFPLVKPLDDLIPTVMDIDPGIGYTGEGYYYAVNIGDDTYVDYATARLWTDTKELTPAMLWRDGIQDWTLQFNIPDDSTEPIHVQITVIDLSGNMAISNEGIITVVDDEPPVLVSSSVPGSATTGDPYEVVVEASDNVGVAHVWLAHSIGADVPIVEEMEMGPSGEYKRTFAAPHVFEQKGRIMVSIEDGTYNVTVIDQNFDIRDNDAPSINGGSEDDIILGDYVVFQAPDGTDNIGITNLTWSFKYRGGHVEVYGEVFNYTFTEVGDHPITLRASDAAGLYDLAYFMVHVMPALPLPDLDKDGIPDQLDDDDDGDGWSDVDESAWGLDPMNASSMPVDTDMDGKADIVDTDDDCDDVDDSLDAFPLDRTEWSDLDGDGVGDNSDLDDDNDTMPDLWEISHGLDPRVAVKPSDDSDDDGLSDMEEFQKGTDPGSADSDGDGMPDLYEVQKGLDPVVKDSTADSDDDGYTNLEEYNAGTDPKSVTSIPKEAEASGGDTGISVPIAAAVAIGAAALSGIVVYLSKKGYDHYKARSDLSSSGVKSNPMYEDHGDSSENPLYEGRHINKGWDGTVKGRGVTDDPSSATRKGWDGKVKGRADENQRKGGWDLATNKGGIEESSSRKGWDGTIKGSSKVDDADASSFRESPTKASIGKTSLRESPTRASTGKTSLRESPTKQSMGETSIRESPTEPSMGETALRESPTKASTGKTSYKDGEENTMRSRPSGIRESPTEPSRGQDYNSSRSNKTASNLADPDPSGGTPQESSISNTSKSKHTKTGHVTLLK